jgi:hypothetical protein
MSRLLPLVVLVGLLIGAGALADNSSSDRSTAYQAAVETDEARIQGTWTITGVECDGKDAVGGLGSGIVGLTVRASCN